MKKVSIRYYLGKPVRAFWDEEKKEWLYSATDICLILSSSKDPRRYWNNLKRRKDSLRNITRQAYLYTKDGKRYLSDVLPEKGILLLTMLISPKDNQPLKEWMNGSLDPLDTQSKKRAYELYENDLIKEEDLGKSKSLQQIHAYLFGGLYDFAGKIRTKTISKGGFVFANGDYLPETLENIDKMPDSTLEEILHKYVEMNIAHPFMEGNGRSTRIWLDMLLKNRLGVCVDWSKIGKKEYLSAMEKNPYDEKEIFSLLKGTLTKDIDNREVFLKGIDYSYYYEEIDD